MTLIPVKSTSCFVDRFSNFGGSRCMLLRLPSFIGFKPSILSPMTLKRRPLTWSPVGIVIGCPRLTTSIPRLRPSVESMAMVRMVFSPMSCCTSVMSLSPLSRVISKASNRFGRFFPSSKATSMTGPMICAMRPTIFFSMILLLLFLSNYRFKVLDKFPLE